MTDKTTGAEQQEWGSAFGFIVSTVGYAVGLGAIWKFPYMIGSNGGGVFLLVCVLFIVILAIPLCWAELTMGRYSKVSAIAGMRKLEGGSSPWVAIGWFSLATVFILISYYITIVSDVMFYIFKFISGGLRGMSMDQIAGYYSGLQVDMPYKFITVLIMYAISIVILIGGVQKGLERANKILIPGLFIFLVILSIRNLMLPDAMEGVKWMWTPDFSKLTPSVIMAALNQCIFFSGVGMATLFSFGSYLNEDADIPFYGLVCMLSNVVVGILAGTAIFTALFSYGMDVAAGSGLVFQTMPYVFNEMAGGVIWGGLFFILLFAAGLSTIIGLYEGAASVLGDAVGWDRKKSIFISFIILFILGIPTILSTTAWANITPLGMDLFTFMDFVAMLITCPIAMILISIYAGTKFWDRFMEQSAIGAKYFKVPSILKFWYVIVMPIIIALVVILGIKSYF